MSYLQALLPAFLFIVVGYILHQQEWVKQHWWKRVESLTYFLLLPSLLFSSLASADFQAINHAPLLSTAMFVSILLMSLFVLAARPLCRIDGPSFTSVYQGAIRPNLYIAISASAILYGDKGLIMASLVVAVLVPVGNIFSVLVLAFYAESKRSLSSALKAVISNPMIAACVLGIAVNISGLGINTTLDTLFGSIGKAALPLGLMAVGAGLRANTGDVWHQRTVVYTSVFKLLLFPLLTLVICLALGLEMAATTIVVLFTAVPGSGSAYVLAGQMGGNQTLLAAIITSQTMLAMLTMPLILWFSDYLGLLLLH
ncbi:MAG: AEC family transporter [Gammaproteobacteria bacterium]|nr:AEC family transporter [Gammaproteobacteria bacterium]